MSSVFTTTLDVLIVLVLMTFFYRRANSPSPPLPRAVSAACSYKGGRDGAMQQEKRDDPAAAAAIEVDDDNGKRVEALTEAQRGTLQDLRARLQTYIYASGGEDGGGNGGGEGNSSSSRSPTPSTCPTTTPRFLLPAAETDEVFLLRFLRARKFHADKAWAMVEEHLEWRRREAIDDLASKHGAEVLGAPVEELWAFLPSWTQGFDRTGAPVRLGVKSFTLQSRLKLQSKLSSSLRRKRNCRRT